MLKYNLEVHEMEKTYKLNRELVMNELYQYDLIETLGEFDELTITIINQLDELDDIISNTLFNYTIERLAYIDRAIIRLATYELKETETASAIIIDEAVKLTKKYSDLDDERQHKFNNSVIDNINKFLRG